MRRYLAVLRVRHARPLLLAALLGRLSFAMGSLALVLFVQHATGSFATAGVVSAAAFLANGLLAPARGRLVDRYGPRRVLLPLAVVYAAGLAGVVAAVQASGSTLTTATLAVLAGAAAPPLAASMRALWTELLGHGPQLQTAYALDAVLEEVVFTVGPLLAGVLAAVDPAAGLLVAAGLGVVGTAGFVASPLMAGRPAHQPEHLGWGGALAGRGLRVLVGSLAGVAVAIGIWELALVAAASQRGAPAAGGLLLALMAAGSAAGGLWYGARRWRWPASRRFPALLGLAVLACAPMAVTPGLAALGAAALLVGAVVAPMMSTAYVLAAELAPAGTLTEAGTWVTTATNVLTAAGIVLAGVMLEWVGLPWTLAAAAGWVALGLLVAITGRSSMVATTVSSAAE